MSREIVALVAVSFTDFPLKIVFFKENKELAIQVIEDLIIEYEQKVEGYVASNQIHTCTDQVKTGLFLIETSNHV